MPDAKVQSIFREQVEREAQKAITDDPKFNALIPDRGFLHDYVPYAADLTDAPEEYHLFVALSLLGAWIAPNIHLPLGAQKLRPNLWVLLLGSSSLMRKTTAIGIGRRLMYALDGHPILATESTPEALLESLKDQPNGLLVWSEFSSAIASFGRSYMDGMKELLTDLYDAPPQYQRKLKTAEYTLINPHPSILSGSTPTWFQERFREGDVRGGFLARFLFVSAKKKRKCFPLPQPLDQRRQNDLRMELTTIVDSIRDDDLELDLRHVRPIYEKWYRGYEAEIMRIPDLDRLAGFYTRLGVSALKIAIIYQATLFPGEPDMCTESLEYALKVADYLRERFEDSAGDLFRFGKNAQDERRVLEVVSREPGIKRGDLLRITHLRSPELNEITQTLVEQEAIETFKQSSGRGPRAVLYYLKGQAPRRNSS